MTKDIIEEIHEAFFKLCQPSDTNTVSLKGENLKEVSLKELAQAAYDVMKAKLRKDCDDAYNRGLSCAKECAEYREKELTKKLDVARKALEEGYQLSCDRVVLETKEQFLIADALKEIE